MPAGPCEESQGQSTLSSHGGCSPGNIVVVVSRCWTSGYLGTCTWARTMLTSAVSMLGAQLQRRENGLHSSAPLGAAVTGSLPYNTTNFSEGLSEHPRSTAPHRPVRVTAAPSTTCACCSLSCIHPCVHYHPSWTASRHQSQSERFLVSTPRHNALPCFLSPLLHCTLPFLSPSALVQQAPLALSWRSPKK